MTSTTDAKASDRYAVERRHSGTEDGPLWYVVAPDGSLSDGGGWLNRADAEHDAAHLNATPCECGGAFERHDRDAEPERDTTSLLGHPYYDRDSEAAPWRGLLPPYDVEPADEPDDVATCNCECSYCEHERGCANRPEGRWTMDYVGAICDACAGVIVAHGGGAWVHPIHARGASC